MLLAKIENAQFSIGRIIGFAAFTLPVLVFLVWMFVYIGLSARDDRRAALRREAEYQARKVQPHFD